MAQPAASPADPRLLLVAHGTRSATGLRTTEELTAAVRAARPGLRVDLCYLDVAAPSLADALAEPGAAVLVPALLSTGYHVQTDIPAAVAGRDDVRVSRHLGPHPLLTTALVERLREARAARPDAPQAATTVLVATGSSRPEAATEIAEAAQLLAAELGRTVRTHTLAEDLVAAFAAAAQPVEVATYLLAEGQFVDTIRAAAAGGVVADPLGVHPSVVRLILARYDEARATD
jgi:sirohydrochlorin ferrochelatase